MKHKFLYKCERCGEEFVVGLPIDDAEIDELVTDFGRGRGSYRAYAIHRCMNTYKTCRSEVMGIGRLVGFVDYIPPEEDD